MVRSFVRSFLFLPSSGQYENPPEQSRGFFARRKIFSVPRRDGLDGRRLPVRIESRLRRGIESGRAEDVGVAGEANPVRARGAFGRPAPGAVRPPSFRVLPLLREGDERLEELLPNDSPSGRRSPDFGEKVLGGDSTAGERLSVLGDIDRRHFLSFVPSFVFTVTASHKPVPGQRPEVSDRISTPLERGRYETGIEVRSRGVTVTVELVHLIDRDRPRSGRDKRAHERTGREEEPRLLSLELYEDAGHVSGTMPQEDCVRLALLESAIPELEARLLRRLRFQHDRISEDTVSA